MDLTGPNTFSEIYSLYYRKSYLYVKSYVHDNMVAEDIVSEALIKLWERMKQKPVELIAPYLFSILKNRALDYLKHQAIQQSVHNAITQSLNREIEIRITSLEASDPNDIFSNEVHKIIEDTLNSLSERTKEIFILSRFENKSHKEIAEIYRISVKGVDYHINLSVKELRNALKDYLPIIGLLTFLKL